MMTAMTVAIQSVQLIAMRIGTARVHIGCIVSYNQARCGLSSLKAQEPVKGGQPSRFRVRDCSPVAGPDSSAPRTARVPRLTLHSLASRAASQPGRSASASALLLHRRIDAFASVHGRADSLNANRQRAEGWADGSAPRHVGR